MTFRNNVLREIAVHCGYKEALSCGGQERALVRMVSWA